MSALTSRRGRVAATLVDLLRERAAERPDTPFIYLQDGETEAGRLTLMELEQRARGIAAALAPHRGRPVLLCYPPGLEYIAGFFGTLFAGAVAVPAYSPERIRQGRMIPRLEAIARDAGAAALLTTPEHMEETRSLLSERVHLPDAAWIATGPESAHDAAAWQAPPLVGDDLAFLMYTSGSTGTPKGGMLTHGSALHNLTRFPGFASRHCGCFVSWLPFFHDLGLFMGMLHPLNQGCPSVLMPPLAFAQKPVRWIEALSRFGGTTTGGPNFAYDLCVWRSTPEERAALDLSAWNLALNGSEPVRVETLERFTAAFAPAGFRPETFYPSYGLAEASATVTGPLDAAAPVFFFASRRATEQGEVVAAERDEETAQLLVGCGPVIDDETLLVVDPETCRPCAAGRIGEIWVGGPSIAKGYWNRPEETDRQLRARLAGTGDGPFLRTGDLGFVRDGALFLTGRLKDLLILRGVNHHPEDIEDTIARSVPGVRPNCGAAFAVEVGGEERLAVVWEAGVESAEDLDRTLWHIRQAVARVHEIEIWAIVLIAPKALPKTSSGKIQRKLCREIFLAEGFRPRAAWRLPDASSGFGVEAPPAPATVAPAAIRERLIAHFSRRLGVPPAAIGRRETFDRFGLASVDAVRLTTELGEWLGLALPPTLVWSFPSIDDLSGHLAARTGWSGEEPEPAEETAAAPDEPIAIVGMGCRFPGAPGLEAFWHLLTTGTDAVGVVPPDRWDAAAFWAADASAPGKMVSRYGGFLPDLDQFDPEFFGITPREAAHLDPRQRLLLESAWEALEDAGIAPHTLRGSRTGVFVATLADEYESLVGVDRIDAYMGPGTSDTVVANRLSYFFDLTGPSVTVNTACSGSLVAIHLACQSLRSGESALAVAGGVNVILLPKGNVFFSKAGALSPTGRCRTFDSRADGIVRSDGAGIVVLKPLSRAVADGDPVYALIRGSAVNSDGRSNGIMAPNGRAQEALLREAYRRAGVDPQQVQYVEAHGTGTPVGDPIEAQALGAVVGAGRPADRPCRLGSLKTNVGHMEAAAGIGGIIKVALAMRRGALPPSLHYLKPNPLIAFADLGLAVQTELARWPAGDGESLLAGVSGFGFGGTNAHVVLERPALFPAPRRDTRRGPWLLPLSAHRPEALRDLAARYRELAADPEAPLLSDACTKAAAGRSPLDHRLGLVAGSWNEVAEGLAAFLEGRTATGLAVGPGESRSAPPRVAFIFSGQGSHWLGMGRELLQREPVFRASLEETDRILRELAGWSLLEELAAGPEISRLDRTEVTQPAIFAVQVALAALWRSWGIEPEAVAGQSLGEIAAACVAGALPLAAAARVVVERARRMQAVEGQGATAVVGLPFREAELALTGWEDQLSVAGSNSPRSSVIAGDGAALDRVVAGLERRGVFCRRLKGVGVAFHSPHMDALRPELEAALADLAPRPAVLPLFSGLTGTEIAGERLDAAYWGRQLREPFLFADCAERLVRRGIDVFLEVSPHPVLGAVLLENLQILGHEAAVLPSLRRQEEERATLLGSLAALWARGVNPDWSAAAPQGDRSVALPAYPWQRERHWCETGGTSGVARERRRAHGHPLLGEHLELARPAGAHLWEIDLEAESLRYLADHKVQSAVVFPGAAFLEMAVGALASLGAGPWRLRAVRFLQPLVIPPDGVRRLQLVLTPHAGGFLFEVLGRPVGEVGLSEEWSSYVTGEAAAPPSGGETPAMLPLAGIRGRCREERDGRTFYESLAAQGLHMGPAFQPLRHAWRRDGEALAEMVLPPEAAVDAGRFIVHPVYLDSLFQLVSATLPAADGKPGVTYLPLGIEELEVYARSEAAMLACAVLREESEPGLSSRRADLYLMAPGGAIAAVVRGLTYQALGAIERKTETLDDQLYEVAWQPVERAAEERAEPGRWLLLVEAGPAEQLGRDLAAWLEARGDLCTCSGTLPDGGAEVAKSAMAGLPWRGIVDLRALSAPAFATTTAVTLADAALRLCDGALELVQAAARLASVARPRLWWVTSGAQASDAASGRREPVQALLWGLGRVAAREHPEIWGGLIDLDPALGGEAAAAQLGRELRAPDGEDQILLTPSGRRAARLVRPAVAAAPSPVLRPEASYLITGGLTGLGLETARWMATHGARRLILTGRTLLPPRVAWQDLAAGDPLRPRVDAVLALEALGVSVTVAPVDAADADALAGFLAAHRREGWPPIRGVVHSAGVLRDRVLLHADRGSLDAVLRPKVLGAWLLHDLLRDEPLDFFALYASAASVLPLPGQGAYAAANAFLGALAAARRAAGLPAVSFDWGPWSEVGLAARLQLAGQHEQAGMRGIDPARGLEAVQRLLVAGPPQIAVMAADWPTLLKLDGGSPLLRALAAAEAPAGAGAPQPAEGGVHPFLFDLLLLPDAAARRELVESRFIKLVSEVMRLEPARIDRFKALTALGLDSIMAMELNRRLETTCGAGLSLMELLMGASVTQLAARLLERLEQDGEMGAIAEILAEVEAGAPHDKGGAWT